MGATSVVQDPVIKALESNALLVDIDAPWKSPKRVCGCYTGDVATIDSFPVGGHA